MVTSFTNHIKEFWFLLFLFHFSPGPVCLIKTNKFPLINWTSCIFNSDRYFTEIFTSFWVLEIWTSVLCHYTFDFIYDFILFLTISGLLQSVIKIWPVSFFFSSLTTTFFRFYLYLRILPSPSTTTLLYPEFIFIYSSQSMLKKHLIIVMPFIKFWGKQTSKCYQISSTKY